MSTRIHYIDPAHGDDANDGLSPARPVRNYADRGIRPGDTVLFKRGSVVRGPLRTCDGAEGAPVTYGAYGDGENPAFLGSVAIGDPAAWVEVKPHIWRYDGSFASEVCNLVFNGGQSCAILRWELADLKNPGDWHYTGIGMHSADGDRGDSDGVLYLCSAANPGAAYAGIECVLWGARRMVGGSHVILENLSFRNSGVHGYFHVGARNAVIRNCEFRFIGGAVWSLKHRVRFGNGLELWDGANDIVVEGCVFDNIYDSAVTHQGGETRNIPERIHFRDNLFVDCGLSAYESREPAREVYFEHNTCINSGGGFSMQGESPPRRADPYPQPVGYHVFIFYIDPGSQPGPVYIRHNLFYESHGAAISAIIDPVDERKFVIDHNGYWQTTGESLMQFTRLPEGKTTTEAIQDFLSTGAPWPLDLWRSCRPSEFPGYQAESGQDRHSRVTRPLFVDPAGNDYRQRADSPCLAAGMRGGKTDVMSTSGNTKGGESVMNRLAKSDAALSTTAHRPTRAGPPRVFRVIYNQDCSHVFGHIAKQERAITPNDIDGMIDEVADGGAELMLINPNGQIGRVNYPSRVWQAYWDQRENMGGGLAKKEWFRNKKHLADGGHDYLALSLGRCRERGIAAGVSVRMNDVHDTPWPDRPVHSDFWRAHPEWWIEGPYRPEGDYSIVRAMDYRRPEVREYFLALIREIVTDYPPDVLELDFMRYPLYFPPDVARDCCDTMTGFVREVRGLLGGDQLLYARAPVTVAAGLDYGLDYATWAREGLIDGVTVAAHFNTPWDIDMAAWRRAVGERVALHACAESSAYSPDGGRHYVMGLDEKLLRGFAAANRAQGADGIYLFNFFCAREWTGREPLFSAIGQLADPAGLEGKPKTYCLTAAAGGWHLPESDGPLQVARAIGPRESQTFRLLMGPEPSGLPVDVEIVTDAPADPAKVRLHVNEQVAGAAIAGEAAPGAANSLVFRTTSDVFRSGSNTLVVCNDGPLLTVLAVVARVR